MLRTEEFPMKEYEIDGSAGDAGVSYVKDRLEEDEVLSAPDREPGWKIRIDQGKIEHIDHFAEADGGISASGREELGDLCVGRFGEERTVKEAVEDIAAGADHYQCNADQHADGCFGAAEEAAEIDYHYRHQCYSQENKYILADVPAEGHPECHSFVFDESELEPVTDDVYRFT